MTLRLHEAPVDESPWIARARQGDADAQSWLVSQYTAPVYRFCRAMLGNEQDGRDAAQDTLVKVLRNLERYDDQWRFSTWVFGIARNTCIDEYRRRRHNHDDTALSWVADPNPGPVELGLRQERAAILHGALAQLPDMYREILILYHFEHLKYEEIAAALDLPLGTVMNRIFRARRKLKDIYVASGEISEGGAP